MLYYIDVLASKHYSSLILLRYHCHTNSTLVSFYYSLVLSRKQYFIVVVLWTSQICS